MRTVLLLICSNIFMTIAWYGHLKYRQAPLMLVIVVSWLIAFLEYCFQVPANRLGYGEFTAFQLKIIQEVITLTVFTIFAWVYSAKDSNGITLSRFCFWSAPWRLGSGESSNKRCARIGLTVSETFDIPIDALGSRKLPNEAPPESVGTRLAVPASTLDTLEHSGGRFFFIETFGCQMNVHDSEKVAGVLMGRGYRPVENAAQADLLLYNTCSIREKAAQKVFSRLGEFKEAAKQSGKVIGVLGCVAQQEGEEIFERAPWVSLVCGSASYRKLPELVARLEAGGRRVTGLDLDTDETFETEITRRDNPFRAYLTIIEGCDYACAYCVVPHTRGPERSRASDAILSEVRRLANAGYTEIQLLGQTVNSYRDPSPRGMNFVELLRAVAAVPGIRRVRFTTSHPNDFHREIVDAIDEIPTLCDHIHLPVQSGSTRILKSMRRTYSREEYLEKISWIRAARRPAAVTTDIIVGFPGETEKDFEDTVTLLDAVRYDGVFSFKYSPRPNTPALTMAGAIPEEEKGRRLAILQDRQRQIQIERNESLIGETFEVLVDGRHAQRGQWSGRTTGNRVLNFASRRENILGEYVQVRVTRAGPNSLVGEHIEGF